MLDFLGLHDTYSEKDLEAGAAAGDRAVSAELGAWFAFVARQNRSVVDGEDFYLELRFYIVVASGSIRDLQGHKEAGTPNQEEPEAIRSLMNTSKSTPRV